MPKPSISIIVTNYNGYHIIKKSLPCILKNSPEASEIIFSDDASSDQSLLFVKKLQKTDPRLKIIAHQKNIGFASNSNFAVSKATGEFVALLNSDIYPLPNYLKGITKHFSDEAIFGIGFAEKGNENWGHIYWQEGTFQYTPGDTNIDKVHQTGWLSGGSCIVRKEYFQKLNGFDLVYSPFYSEDLDLGYRAWKSGYTLLWDPAAEVIHKHEATISKFPKKLLDYIKERNRLLVVWRNITDKDLLRKNKVNLIYRVLFGPNYIKIILAALRQIKKYPPPIVDQIRTDRQIFDLFSNEKN